MTSLSLAAEPIKIFVVVANLEMGGAQRLTIDLLTHVDRRRLSPSLVLSAGSGQLLDQVPSDCEVLDLRRRSRWDFPAMVLRLAGMIRHSKPQAILSLMFHGNVLALLARRLSGVSVPVIISEHIAYTSYQRGPALPRRIGRAVYPWADRAVGVSSGVAGELASRWQLDPDRIHRIFNPVDLSKVRTLARVPLSTFPSGSGPTIVAVGRLTRQKGFEYLISALARVRRYVPATLVLVGDGEEAGRLRKLAHDEGVVGHVQFAGADPNPYRWMNRSSVFVLSSLYEGFALVAVEALGLGLPVVATDCPYGPAEILEGGRHGLLVAPGDERALADAIVKILVDDSLRTALRASGLRRARDFDAPTVARQYEALFEITVRRMPVRKVA